MKKALLKIMLVCMVICSALYLFSACDASPNGGNGKDEQENSFKIAGLYEFKGLQPFVLDDLIFSLTYSSYEFFESGFVNVKYIGATSDGGYIERSGKATYSTEKISDDSYHVNLYVLETQKTAEISYYGMSIYDGDITLNLTGPNMFNELEGTVAMVQYGLQVEYFDGVSDIPFGTIDGEKTQYVNKGGNTSSVAAYANDGFQFVGWSDGNDFSSRNETDVKNNIKIYAKFRQVHDVYKMEYNANEGGQLEGNSLQYVLGGEYSAGVTATPYSSYLFTSWSDGATSATRSDLANNNLSVTANFDYKYTINYSGLPTETKRYGVKGATVEAVTAAQISGYKFVRWSDGVTSETRQDVITDELINANSYDRYTKTIDISAIYEQVKTLSYGVWPENSGYIDGNANQSLYDGQSGTEVTAVAEQGYRFSHWERSSTPVGENPTRTDTMVNIDITYVAIFERVCTLIYRAEEGGYIEGATEQVVLYGEGHPENVQAVANAGYEFIGWSDGYTSPYRYDDRPTTDIDVTARFKNTSGESSGEEQGGSEGGNSGEQGGGFNAGDGTAENPYEISSIVMLKNVVNYPDAYFVLTDDIILSEVAQGQSNFTPLFSDDNMFNGTLDGNGYTIRNLTIYNVDTFYSGLFACIGSNGVVKNLKLTNLNISGTNYIGGIAGYSLGKITDCETQGKITYIQANTYKVFIGGVAGRIENDINGNKSDTEIVAQDCGGSAYIGGITGYLVYSESISISFTNSITATGADYYNIYAGGLFGAGYSCTITDSYSTGDISAVTSGNGGTYAGGLVGHGSSCTIATSYSTGKISATSSRSSYAGGLIGYVDSSCTITNSYSTGDITATGADNYDIYAGGLVGHGSSCTITNSYYTGNISAATVGSCSYAGGLVGDSYSCTITNSYSTGNISATGSRSSFAGGLIGYVNSSCTITNSYSTGNMSATGADNYNIYAGGLVGGGSCTIATSYSTGNISATGSGYSFAGGLVGSGSSCTITNSFTISEIIAETGYIGGFIGNCNTFTLTNAHWLKYQNTNVNYAVGYSDSLGIPTSIGATAHNSAEDFKTLAEELNEGLETPVWHNEADKDYPTLMKEEQE